MSLALQRCCRREHNSVKRHASARLRNASTDLIQTDLSLPILDSEHRGGMMPGRRTTLPLQVNRIAAIGSAQMPSGERRNCFATA
jgi:hypothetical protein